jgi:hypothetical protein
MEEVMMRLVKRNVAPLALVYLLLLPAFMISTSARAEASNSFIQAGISDSGFLNETKSLEYDVTPLSNGSDTWRYLNWNWSESSALRYGGSQLGFDLFNSGSAHNFVFVVNNAVDVELLSGAGNPVSCERRNPYEQSGKTYFTAVCYSSYKVELGHTFRLKVMNDSTRGPTWFKASFDDLVSGLHLEIGSINAGDKNYSQPLKSLNYYMGAIDQVSCSKTGVNDTIFSNVRNSGATLKNFSSQSIGTCGDGVIVPNKFPLGGQVFKLGGSNPRARNLEANIKTNSAPTQQTERISREWREVPVPDGLLRGLYTFTFDGYFNDRATFGEGATPFARGNTESKFPRFDNSGLAENTTLIMNGYFIPDVTGEWKFRIESDDAAFMWLGNEAITRYRNANQGAVIRNGGVHTAKAVEYSVSLVKDKIYPIRIIYGNDKSVPVFKFDTKAPGYPAWQSDTQGLMWHTEPGYCTNWGIGYALVASLGFDDIPPTQACKASLAAASNTTGSSKPSKPTFSLVNFSDNKINVSVNLGTGTSAPEKVYLVAPNLGATEASKIFGEISGNVAKWSLSIEKLLTGTGIPLKIVSIKNGLESDPLEGAFNVPSGLNKTLVSKSVPPTPKNIKTRIIGTSAYISAESTVKSGSVATSAYVFGSSIGVSKSKALVGDLVGSKALLEVPIKASMAGKKLVVSLYFSNEAGESQPAQAIIDVPAIPTSGFARPNQVKVPNTIFCTKGSISRTFAAKSCPPGWKKS